MVTLTRFSDDGFETLGTLTAQGKELFVCKTLELPFKSNQNNISCIPAGIYTCRYTQSNRLTQAAGHPVFTYEILNVPGRAGIRIHSANYFTQLLGCIATGSALKDINSDGRPDALHSGETIAKFEAFMEHKEFQLLIQYQPSQSSST